MNKILSHHRVLITGGTSGLGLELAKLFTESGAEVYITGRRMPDIKSFNGNCHFVQVDFTDLGNIRHALSDISSTVARFDLIICNAGVLGPPEFTTTGNGFEYTMQVNYLSHLLICEEIIRSLPAGEKTKLAFITSPVFKYVRPGFTLPVAGHYHPFRTYCESKYYLLLTGTYLKTLYPGHNIEIIGIDPGTFSSGIYRTQKKWFHLMYKAGSLFMRNPETVAKGIFRILSDMSAIKDGVYKYNGKGFKKIPELNEVSIKFLASCLEALNTSANSQS